MSQQQKSSTVPPSWFGVCGSNASSSAYLQDSTYLEGDVRCRPLEEEVIISWSEKASKKYVSKELAKEIRVKAEPFIKWLKEAEEESSGGEEEDEDENIEVVYSKTASVPKVETVKSDNKDDDIDIDAI